jgi:hypothetical protein
MTVKTETNTLGDGIKWEESNDYSREKVTVLSGQNLALLEVIGKVLLAVPTTGTAGGTNTGNGTCTGVAGGKYTATGIYALTCLVGGGSGAITVPTTGTADVGNAGANTMGSVTAGAAVKAGTYNMVCTDVTTAGSEIFQVTDPDGLLLPSATVAVAYTNAQINFTIADPGTNAEVGDAFTVLATAAAGNSGVFSVRAPDGGLLPDATVAVAYANDNINFTINDGSTDFVVGDSFTITVAAGSGKVVALDPDGVNGANHAAGIMVAAVDATSADKLGAAVVREAMIDSVNLVWPTGISAGDKAIALADLEALEIVAVETA